MRKHLVPVRILAGMIVGFMSGTLGEIRRHEPEAQLQAAANNLLFVLLVVVLFGGWAADFIESKRKPQVCQTANDRGNNGDT